MADWNGDEDDDVEKRERDGGERPEDVENAEWGGRDRPETDWHDDQSTEGLGPDPADAPDDGKAGRPTLAGVVTTTGVALLLIGIGVVVGGVSLSAAALFLTATVGVAVRDDVVLTIVLGTVFLQGVGFGVAALGYLRYRGLGLEFVRVRWPDRGDVVWAIIGSVGAYGIMIAGNILLTVLGIEGQSHELGQLGAQNPELLLVLIPLSFLLIGPGEELLFRGVIQTAFVERVGIAGGIVATSAIFALIHLPNYGWIDGLPTIGLLFVVSLTWGYIYERTDSLFVPAMAHAAFNAFQFLILYIVIQYAPDAATVIA
jgi:membrane protease YdiL (CAAX protease family)